jgi:hypothetical protein
VLSLEAAELKAESFFEPIDHDAERTVLKADRKATNEHKEMLASCLARAKLFAELYRSSTITWNRWERLFKESHSQKSRRSMEEEANFIRHLEGYQKYLDAIIRQLLKQRT